jgi:hypothetical protein
MYSPGINGGVRDPYSGPLSTSKSAVLSTISWTLGARDTASIAIIEEVEAAEEISRPELMV